jgi:tRNA 2-thiouridine synthesizing protein A
MSRQPPVIDSLDLCGLQCPLPILRTKKALAALKTGDVVELICTDPATPVDFADFCERTGNTLLRHWQDEGKFLFLIQKR